MTPDASNYPFPTVARLALSMYASGKRIERLPRVIEYAPTEYVEIAHCDRVSSIVASRHPMQTLTIGGDL